MRRFLLAAILAVMALPAWAQQPSYNVAIPLTTYTLYATGSSTSDPISIGGRINRGVGGYAILRLVSPLSFFFGFSPSFATGAGTVVGTNLSGYFLPANEVGWFRVPWGQFISVMVGQVLGGTGDSRATIYITELE